MGCPRKRADMASQIAEFFCGVVSLKIVASVRPIWWTGNLNGESLQPQIPASRSSLLRRNRNATIHSQLVRQAELLARPNVKSLPLNYYFLLLTTTAVPLHQETREYCLSCENHSSQSPALYVSKYAVSSIMPNNNGVSTIFSGFDRSKATSDHGSIYY